MEKEEVAMVAEEEEIGDGKMDVIRVLVVDDSLLQRKIVEKLLLRSKSKFEVSTVESGRKAMEVLGLTGDKIDPRINEDRKIDVVLTDYFMPEMDGYELLKAIKENGSTKSIPVVIMSSENDSQRINRCLASGAEEFIIKPLQTKHLQRLANYARPQTPAAKAGKKRKLTLDALTECSDSARRPRLAGVTVA